MLFGGDSKEKKSSKKEVGTVISQGTSIEGEIKVKESIRIDGELKGQLIAEGDILVGKNGQLKADLEGDDIEIAGKVEGDIMAKGKLKLLKDAKLIGDIRYSNLVINDGAVFKGTSISEVNNKKKLNRKDNKSKDNKKKVKKKNEAKKNG